MASSRSLHVRGRFALAVFGLFGGLAASPAAAVIRYVKEGATGANDGTSWSDAHTNLQTALSAAGSGDEIWVAVGTYNPTAMTNPPDPRSATFGLLNDVSIIGGFRGLPGDEGIDDETTRPPDPVSETANPATDSVLSGDLNGDGGPNFANYGENAYNIVTGNSTNASAVLDAFTIRGGNANGSTPFDVGGGLNINTSGIGGSPTIRTCRFLANSAVYAGAVYIDDHPSSTPTFDGCLFRGNQSTPNAGGAVWPDTGSRPTFTNCVFESNTAGQYGGALFVTTGGSPTVTGCTFSANTATGGAGAIHNLGGTVIATACTFTANSGPSWYENGSGSRGTDCTFIANVSSNAGGAFLPVGSSNPVLTNCRFFGNRAAVGGAI